MFRVLCVAVYEFAKKRTKTQKHMTRNYFLAMGMIWGVVTLLIGGLGELRDVIAGKTELILYLKICAALPVAGFLLGDIFGFIPWLIWFRHDEDFPKNKKT